VLGGDGNGCQSPKEGAPELNVPIGMQFNDNNCHAFVFD